MCVAWTSESDSSRVLACDGQAGWPQNFLCKYAHCSFCAVCLCCFNHIGLKCRNFHVCRCSAFHAKRGKNRKHVNSQTLAHLHLSGLLKYFLRSYREEYFLNRHLYTPINSKLNKAQGSVQCDMCTVHVLKRVKELLRALWVFRERLVITSQRIKGD